MESRRQGLWILALIFGAAVFYLSIRFFSENEESRVRRAVYGGVLAIEQGDPVKCMSFVSDGYQDAYGNDKASLLRVTTELLRDFRIFKVDIKQLKIELKEGEAETEVSFKCYFKKVSENKMYYDLGRLKIRFQREGRRWRARSLEYLGAKDLEMLFLQGVA